MANLYTAYFDESGTHQGSELVAVGGFVSNVTEWGLFSEKWQAALDCYGLEYFHMTDFENWYGPYEEWTEAEHKNRLNYFLEIIHEHVFQSIGCIVLKDSFDSIMSPKAKALCGDAYGLAAIACFTNLADTAKKPELDGVLDYVMECGAKGGGALLQIYQAGRKDPDWRNKNRIISLDFRDKRVFLPLQAADIMAYELYKRGLSQFGLEQRPIRYPLRQLARQRNQEWHYLDDDELRRADEWLAALPVSSDSL